MNIIQIIPGSGGSFYCGNCLRDSKYFNAMRAEGHKVTKIPMYLPLFADEHDISEVPIFYGAISLYLKQVYPVFRKAPGWVDKLLNSKMMMKMAASMAGSTRAKGLEDMTISMLLGEQGEQKAELELMVNWIAEHCKPDIIHISNALLLGLAKRLKEKIGVPVFCSLQDEDVWIDPMQPQFQKKIWDLMHERAKDVDALVSVSHFFADVMKQRMSLPDEKVRTIHLGVDVDDYQYISPGEKERNIGYISRMCHKDGFDIVVDAFVDLKKKPGFDDVKLIATGGATGDDTRFNKAQKKKLKENNLLDSFEILPDFEGKAVNDFFKRVALVSVPVRIGEAFGMYLLESMASGVPVVQPALGAFPEIVELSGGGVTYMPNTPQKLSETWADLLSSPEKMEELSRNGYEATREKFNIHNHAKEIIGLYESFCLPESDQLGLK
ncbi:Glycosyltransferase involved in cell wall bisynthesis [Mariniphaga anaerophila]|uniref:Glycosyltransferase involved in cell wall bisynthesis n=1 Tax=Mariniphaga anaerophila TaxID=1484053 RepID=A0A1M5DQ57_9BACT|nr:glycosyltransferase family 4 protein [Mariniphaga anaerophila]SHF69168.1 Glycosyltransferase involved in cell wall bisynthesis [Mariniphaga anaerophila]